MIGPIRFVQTVLWLAIALSIFGSLKEATITMASMAVKARGMSFLTPSGTESYWNSAKY